MLKMLLYTWKNSIEIHLLAFDFSMDNEIDNGLRFRPPSGFTDSREFSEAECDRERALDLEVQQITNNNEIQKSIQDELTFLLAR